MASSQEKIQKHVYIIERNIDTIRNESEQTIINEYKQFLQDEIKTENDEKQSLKLDWYKEETIQNRSLANNYLILEDEIGKKKNQLEQLQDEIDNLIINSTAAKASFKIEQLEKEQHTKRSFTDTENLFKQELENDNKKYKIIEQELQNQITAEITQNKARVQETKRNLQKSLVERHSELVAAQNQAREIRKKIGDLKTELAKEKPKNDPRSNIIYFNNGDQVLRTE